MWHICVPDISLRESNDFSGRYFMYFSNGKRLNSYRQKTITIDDNIIEIDEELEREQNQLPITNNQPIFELKPGEIVQYPIK